MSKKYIRLNTDQELRIYMMPLRQKLLHEMAVLGVPVTGKQLADLLGIPSSSAQHHIKKLESIGLIEFDHTEPIGSINARFVRLADADVQIGFDEEGELCPERDAIMTNKVNEAYNGFKKSIEIQKSDPSTRNDASPLNDIVSSVIHFTDEEARQFYSQLRETMDSHAKPRENTKPYDVLMIAYLNEATLRKDEREKGEE